MLSKSVHIRLLKIGPSFALSAHERTEQSEYDSDEKDKVFCRERYSTQRNLIAEAMKITLKFGGMGSSTITTQRVDKLFPAKKTTN